MLTDLLEKFRSKICTNFTAWYSFLPEKDILEIIFWFCGKVK